MNKLEGIISNTTTEGELSMVEVKIQDTVIKSIVVDNPGLSPYLNPGTGVNILFKETEVIIGYGSLQHLSLENRFQCQVVNIKQGTLLSEVKLKFNSSFITGITSSQSLVPLRLDVGQQVLAFVKINEIMISQI